MTLRDVILENKWWKLLSLFLAVVLWLYIDDRTNDEPLISLARGAREATAKFPRRFPVRELVVSGDPHTYTLDPAEVEVTLIGNQTLIRRVRASDILVVADLTTLPMDDVEAGFREFTASVTARVNQPVIATVTPSTIRVRQYSSPPPPISKP
jgi:YbbR domain-containing protein